MSRIILPPERRIAQPPVDAPIVVNDVRLISPQSAATTYDGNGLRQLVWFPQSMGSHPIARATASSASVAAGTATRGSRGLDCSGVQLNFSGWSSGENNLGTGGPADWGVDFVGLIVATNPSGYNWVRGTSGSDWSMICQSSISGGIGSADAHCVSNAGPTQRDTSGVPFPANRPTAIVYHIDPVGGKMQVFTEYGETETTFTGGVVRNGFSYWQLGLSTMSTFTGLLHLAAFWAWPSFASDKATLRWLARSPWQLFAPRRRIFPAGISTAVPTGSGSASLAAISASGAGVRGQAGTAAATLSALTASAAGTRGQAATASATISSVTGSAAGVHGVTGAAAATLQALSSSESGTHGYVCDGLATLQPIQASLAGVHGVVGAASGTLPALTAAAVGEFGAPEPRDGVGSATLPALTARGVGEHDSGVADVGAGGIPYRAPSARGISRGHDDDRDLLEMLPIVIGVIQHAGR